MPFPVGGFLRQLTSMIDALPDWVASHSSRSFIAFEFTLVAYWFGLSVISEGDTQIRWRVSVSESNFGMLL